MLRVINHREQHDPFVNLAMEEYCLKHLDMRDDYVLFYINAPTVVIGRHQVPLAELDPDYVERNGVSVARRISGGGAVYHDLGNLNFAFFTRFDGSRLKKASHYVAPIVTSLRDLGVDAQPNQKNDILVNGAKVSGNALYTDLTNLLIHGTLLVNADLNALRASLSPYKLLVSTKGVASIPSEVANLAELAGAFLDPAGLKARLLKQLHLDLGPIDFLDLGPSQWEHIAGLAASRYRASKWVYGGSPPFVVRHVCPFDFGTYDLDLEVRGGHIYSVSATRTSLQSIPKQRIERRLVGRPFDLVPVRSARSRRVTGG